MAQATIGVQVFESLDKCPPTVARYLSTVQEAIKTELSGKIKKLIWGKKTVGLMLVTFADESSATIAAISGQGLREWTQEEVNFNNTKLKALKELLAKKDITLAPLVYEHEEYQQQTERADIIKPELREAFGEEYIKRFRRRVEGLKEAQLSSEEILAVLKKSTQYKPHLEEDIKTEMVPFYEACAKDERVLDFLCAVMKDHITTKLSGKEWCQQMIMKDSACKVAFVIIEQSLKNADPPPADVQVVADKYIKPVFDHFCIPESALSTFCIALGWIRDPRSGNLANLAVQCAEDNALAALKNLRQGRIVTEIKWVSVTMEPAEITYKPLCPFCEASFERRAMDVNNWPRLTRQ